MHHLRFFSLLLGLTLLLPFHSQAKTLTCDEQKPLPALKAKALIAAVQNRYSLITSLQAKFSQDSYLNALELSERSHGKVWFKKPGQMKWEYVSPEKQTFTVKDQTLWLYQASEKQLVIDQFNKVLISDLPVSFILGLGSLERDFSLRKSCAIAQGTLLDLVPKSSAGKSKEEGLQSVSLLVREGDSVPLGAEISDVGGNITSIMFEDIQTNQSISDDTFVVTYPKGTDIDDRRQG